MIVLPYITKEEMEKFKELIEEKNKREETLNRVDYLATLSARVQNILEINKTYGPIEAYVLVFVKFLKNDMKYHNTDTLYFSWSDMQKYLTDACLDINTGKKILKPSFRNNLRKRGFKTRISTKWNTIKVKKI